MTDQQSQGMITCPDCQGERVVTVLVRYREGMTGPNPRQMSCFCCEGVGQITVERQRRMERGEQLRAAREARRLGLRQAADLWGMKASELSDIETGRVDNSQWSVPEP